jgi:hypothetical protein
MRLSPRERAAILLSTSLAILAGCVWLSVDAVAQQHVARGAPLPAASAVPQDIELLARRDTLVGPILDPFADLSMPPAATKARIDTGRIGRASTAERSGFPPFDLTSVAPANPMGFPSFVPRMMPGSSPTGFPDGVYALGTDTAILAPGGPLVHVGDLVGALRITKIDGTGVYLGNGTVLRPRVTSSLPAATHTPTPAVQAPRAALPLTPAPSSPPAPPPTPASPSESVPQPTPPAVTPLIPLLLQRTSPIVVPTTSVSGGKP